MSAAAILGLLGLAIQLALSVVEYLSGKGKLEAESAQRMAEGLKGVLDEIRQANTARERVRAAVAADPSSVREADKYSRD